MSKSNIEDRVDRLEKLVDDLLVRAQPEKRREKDWRRTVGMFRGDAVMKEVVDDALASRERERREFHESEADDAS